MTCPRGDHGHLALEKHPEAHFCLICGHREYPAYASHVADDSGSGARRHLSPTQKKKQSEVIESLILSGYTNQEVRDTTGYGIKLIDNVGSITRRDKEVQKTLDKVDAHG